MVMADYSEFNNNNYLPGVYNDMEAAAAFNYHSAMAHTRSSGIIQNGFTFTTPTQCSTMATYRPSIQTTSPIRSLSAPGVGASWQHSIPVTMPWADVKSPVSQLGIGTTTIFTGTPVSPYIDGQLSCSSPLRRPKRKALDLPDEAPTSKIFLCADQFANLKISPSEKENYGLPADDGGHTSVQFYSGANTSNSKGDTEGWQRFRDVENRLGVEVDEDVQLNLSSTRNSTDGPRLKVADGILHPSVTSSPILPLKVMEEMISKPCMQIVVWKSPGEIMRDVAKEELTTTTPASTSSSSTVTTSIATTMSKVTDTSTMDISERFPLTPRDNMDLGQDTPMLDPLSHPRFQPVAPVSSGILPLTGFLTSPLSSNLGLPSGHLQAMGVSPTSNNIVLLDSDMFDGLDDDMQL